MYVVKISFDFVSELSFACTDTPDHSHMKGKKFSKCLSITCDYVQI